MGEYEVKDVYIDELFYRNRSFNGMRISKVSRQPKIYRVQFNRDSMNHDLA